MNKALKQFTVFSVGALVLAGCAPLATDTQVVETDTAVSQEATDQVAPIAAEDIQAGAATQTETETLLVFLVEEESLPMTFTPPFTKLGVQTSSEIFLSPSPPTKIRSWNYWTCLE